MATLDELNAGVGDVVTGSGRSYLIVEKGLDDKGYTYYKGEMLRSGKEFLLSNTYDEFTISRSSGVPLREVR